MKRYAIGGEDWELVDDPAGDIVLFSELPSDPPWLDQPDLPGWYWMKHESRRPKIVEVEQEQSEIEQRMSLYVTFSGVECSYKCSDYKAKWQRIADPSLPKE